MFRDELGTNTQALPEFHPPQPVPFSMRQKIEEELERLEKEGIIRPRDFAGWAAPIVAVPKADGSTRICGDYKVTMNKAMVCDTHPIPRSEDLFTAMAGGISYTKLDLSHAYLQLDDKARDYLVIKGCMSTQGCPSAPPLPLQFSSGPWTTCFRVSNMWSYIDILITGESDEEHLATLDEVLSRLETAGVRLKRKKCGTRRCILGPPNQPRRIASHGQPRPSNHRHATTSQHLQVESIPQNDQLL